MGALAAPTPSPCHPTAAPAPQPRGPTRHRALQLPPHFYGAEPPHPSHGIPVPLTPWGTAPSARASQQLPSVGQDPHSHWFSPRSPVGKDTPARPRCFSRGQEPPPQPRKPDSPLQPRRAEHPSRDGPLPPAPQDGSGPTPQNPEAQPPSRTFPSPEVTPAQPDFRLVPRPPAR